MYVPVNTIYAEIIYVLTSVLLIRGELTSMNATVPVVDVLDRDNMNLQALPTEEVPCEECNHIVRATTWSISTRVGSITFFRCPFCGHTWRQNTRA